EQAADLIVMCSHGHTGFKRWVLGSVAQHIARHAQTPVLIMREQGAAPTSAQVEGDTGMRVLVALDGSERAEAVLAPALALAQDLSRKGHGALHLLSVINPYEMVDKELTRESTVNAAQLYLGSVADRLGNKYGAATATTVTWAVAAD